MDSVMRLSDTQKRVIATMYAIAQRQNEDTPIVSTWLMNAINKHRDVAIHGNNFRAGCKTLAQNGLIRRIRNNTTLQLSYQLTGKGSEIAAALIATDSAK